MFIIKKYIVRVLEVQCSLDKSVAAGNRAYVECCLGHTAKTRKEKTEPWERIGIGA